MTGGGINEVRAWLRDIPELCALLGDAVNKEGVAL